MPLYLLQAPPLWLYLIDLTFIQKAAILLWWVEICFHCILLNVALFKFLLYYWLAVFNISCMWWCVWWICFLLSCLSVVLSSEEEEDEDSGTSHVQALEGAKDPHRQQKPVQAMERKMIPDAHIHPSDLNSQVGIMVTYPHRSWIGLLCSIN